MNWREHPVVAALRRDIVTGGRIGLPTDVTVQFFLPAPAPAGSDPLPLLAAAADAAAYVTGMKPVSAWIAPALARGPLALASGAVTLDQKIPVSVTAGWVHGMGRGLRVLAVGTHGLLDVHTERPAFTFTGPDGVPVAVPYAPPAALPEALTEQGAALLAALRQAVATGAAQAL